MFLDDAQAPNKTLMKSRCAEDVIAIDNLPNTQTTRITSTQLNVFVI